jgi:hypothetical protein
MSRPVSITGGETIHLRYRLVHFRTPDTGYAALAISLGSTSRFPVRAQKALLLFTYQMGLSDFSNCLLQFAVVRASVASSRCRPRSSRAVLQ